MFVLLRNRTFSSGGQLERWISLFHLQPHKGDKDSPLTSGTCRSRLTSFAVFRETSGPASVDFSTVWFWLLILRSVYLAASGSIEPRPRLPPFWSRKFNWIMYLSRQYVYVILVCSLYRSMTAMSFPLKLQRICWWSSCVGSKHAHTWENIHLEWPVGLNMSFTLVWMFYFYIFFHTCQWLCCVMAGKSSHIISWRLNEGGVWQFFHMRIFYEFALNFLLWVYPSKESGLRIQKFLLLRVFLYV